MRVNLVIKNLARKKKCFTDAFPTCTHTQARHGGLANTKYSAFFLLPRGKKLSKHPPTVRKTVKSFFFLFYLPVISGLSFSATVFVAVAEVTRAS